MPLFIRVQGPIHTVPFWAKQNKCVDYGGPHCSWEAKAEIRVELDFAAARADLELQWIAKRALEDFPVKGTPDSNKSARSTREQQLKRNVRHGHLYLIQDIKVQNRVFSSQGECYTEDEVVRDMWLLPDTGAEAICVDMPSRRINHDPTRCAAIMGCKLETDWRVDLKVVWMIDEDPKTRNKFLPVDLGSDDKGTVVDDIWYILDKREPAVAQSDVGTAPKSLRSKLNQWEKRRSLSLAAHDQVMQKYSVEPTPSHRGYYNWFPNVPHCAKDKSDGKNRGGDPNRNAIPAVLGENGSTPPAYTDEEKADWRTDEEGKPVIPQTSGTTSQSWTRSDDQRLILPGERHRWSRAASIRSGMSRPAPSAEVLSSSWSRVQPRAGVAVVRTIRFLRPPTPE